MASPLWKYPGQLTGRIAPTQVTPEDGTYVFNLGQDTDTLQSYMCVLDSEISVEQDIDLTGVDLVRCRWNVRTGAMPEPRTLVSASAVTIKTSSLVFASDTLAGIDLGVAGFLADDKDRWCRISGTTSNNNDFRVSAVPVTQTRPTDGLVMPVSPAGSLAVLEGIAAETPASATVKMLGLRWRIQLVISGTEIFNFATVSEQQALWRQTLAANVSKLTGSQTVKFILLLEQYE